MVINSSSNWYSSHTQSERRENTCVYYGKRVAGELKFLLPHRLERGRAREVPEVASMPAGHLNGYHSPAVLSRPIRQLQKENR